MTNTATRSSCFPFDGEHVTDEQVASLLGSPVRTEVWISAGDGGHTEHVTGTVHAVEFGEHPSRDGRDVIAGYLIQLPSIWGCSESRAVVWRHAMRVILGGHR